MLRAERLPAVDVFDVSSRSWQWRNRPPDRCLSVRPACAKNTRTCSSSIDTAWQPQSAEGPFGNDDPESPPLRRADI